MKDLGQTKFYLDLQIEHSQKGIFLHQSTYTKRVLKHFNMNKTTPFSTPVVIYHLMLKVIHFDHLRKMYRSWS